MPAAMRGGDRADQDVAVQHVPQLMREHAFQLPIIHQLEHAVGEGHRGVLGLRPVAKALGDSSGMSHSLGIGMLHALAEILHHGRDAAVDFGIFGLVDRLRVVHRQRDLIGEEVAGEVHGDGHAEPEEEAAAAAEGLSADSRTPLSKPRSNAVLILFVFKSLPEWAPRPQWA